MIRLFANTNYEFIKWRKLAFALIFKGRKVI